MICIKEKKDICDICGKSCTEAYWIETEKENKKEDCFVCIECYVKIKEDLKKPCSKGG